MLHDLFHANYVALLEVTLGTLALFGWVHLAIKIKLFEFLDEVEHCLLQVSVLNHIHVFTDALFRVQKKLLG